MRLDTRCVGPTSAISRFRTSTRASGVPDASRAVGACAAGRHLFHDRSTRFGGPHAHWPLRALSSRCGACGPCLWHRCRFPPVALGACAPMRRLESCLKIGSTPTRERCALDADPRCLPSIGSLCPAAPFRAPGSGLDSTRGSTPRCRGFATFGAFEPCDSTAFDPRSRVPLPASPRFSGSRCRPTTSATLHDARALPASLRSSHARGVFGVPASGPHREMPAALARRCVAASGAGEPRPAGSGLRAPPSTDVERADHEPNDPSEGAAVGRTSRVPSSESPCTRVTGAVRREIWIASRLTTQA